LTKTAYIGFGSNLGEKVENCLAAIDMMAALPYCTMVGRSAFYRTEPLGLTDQDWFINGVCSLRVSVDPRTFLADLLKIEKSMGRVRTERWGPRVIDLDVLLFGEDIIREEGLAIPHLLMHLRRFVLVPITELAPTLRHPVINRTMNELLNDLPEEGQQVIRMGD